MMSLIHICNAMNQHSIEFINKYIYCPYCGECLREDLKKEIKEQEYQIKIVPKLEEIQRALDILDIIVEKILEGTWVFQSQRTKDFIVSYLEVLCWLLGHEKGQSFIDNMVGTEAELAANGVTFYDPRQKEGLSE